MFPAHWALWIPSLADPAVGKVIHVVGDVRNGFEHEFKRNYKPSATTTKHEIIYVSKVASEHVVDVPGNGSRSVDTTAHDDIERAALALPAPPKSLKPVQAGVSCCTCSTVCLHSAPRGIRFPFPNTLTGRCAEEGGAGELPNVDGPFGRQFGQRRHYGTRCQRSHGESAEELMACNAATVMFIWMKWG